MKDTATLSEKETQVIKLIAEGKTKKEIATCLDIPERTVESRTRTAFKKTGCRNFTELVALYLQSQTV